MKMDDSDWVARRAGCTTEALLERIHERMQEDADEINSLPEGVRQGRTVKVSKLNLELKKESFTVDLRGRPRLANRPEVTSVSRQGDDLNVYGPRNVQGRAPDPLFTVTHRWDGNDCEIWMGGDRTAEIWQISKRILYPLVFDEPDAT